MLFNKLRYSQAEASGKPTRSFSCSLLVLSTQGNREGTGSMRSSPRLQGGYNLPTLANTHEPAAAGAMVGRITALLAQCQLLPSAEARDPQQWYLCTSARLRDASTSFKKLLDSPYLRRAFMKNPKTADMYWTLVDSPIDGEDDSWS